MTNNLEKIFAQENNVKLTENGDITYKSTTDKLLDILFMSEFYSKNIEELNKVLLDPSDETRLFAKFMRDPRYGMGKRDLGRALMGMTECSPEEIVKAGRFDDLLFCGNLENNFNYLFAEIANGNELAKKWAPRYSSKNLNIARYLAKRWNMNKQEYGHFVKCNTTENKLSRKNTDDIVFEHIPSLAMIKYYDRFLKKPDTSERFKKYLEDVKAGKKELKVSTTTVYDIFKNREKIDPDLFFDKIEKIGINCLPVVDTSGSMWDGNDSIGKAMAVGHYLAKCSTYAPNKVVSFSSNPQLLTLGNVYNNYHQFGESTSKYMSEIDSMYTGDCSNTDLGKVMELLMNLEGNVPEYLIILSDMEFDYGSIYHKDTLMDLWKEKGYTTKIIWWNFNSRATTCPETDEYGNIFMSGYNPHLLKYLQVGFDGKAFLDELLKRYEENISRN